MTSSPELEHQMAELAAGPYTITLIEDFEAGAWTAQMLEVPGAIGEGDTPDEAVADVKNALLVIIVLSLDLGVAIP